MLLGGTCHDQRQTVELDGQESGYYQESSRCGSQNFWESNSTSASMGLWKKLELTRLLFSGIPLKESCIQIISLDIAKLKGCERVRGQVISRNNRL
jgi:hypothetical protein